MRLIDCPACGQTLSWRAPSCPKCGHPIQRQPARTLGRGRFIFWLVFCLLIGGCCLSVFVPGYQRIDKAKRDAEERAKREDNELALLEADKKKPPTGHGIAAIEWQTFSPPQGGFIVETPDTPSHLTRPNPTGGPAFDIWLLTNRDLEYAILYVQVGHPISVEETFTGLKKNVLTTKPGLQLVSENPLTLQGFSGRAGVFRNSGNSNQGLIRHSYVVGNDSYMLDVEGSDISNCSDAQRFLRSFRLLRLAKE